MIFIKLRFNQSIRIRFVKKNNNFFVFFIKENRNPYNTALYLYCNIVAQQVLSITSSDDYQICYVYFGVLEF